MAQITLDVSDGIPEHLIVSKAIVVVEGLDDDNNQVLWTSTSQGMKAWQTIGLLDTALTIERNALRYGDDDDGDDDDE
jgi:hypothetical protein